MSMKSETEIHRMRVAMEANAEAYRRAVQTSTPGDCWDFVVLTAANEKQAAGYRQELALRHRAVGPTGAFFPGLQRSVVVADPPGRRAGSGGATLGVLRALWREHGVGPGDLGHLRILLIHSGGASQRLPAYSPLGKIFAPLPLLRPDGQICTLFDHLYLTLAGLPERLGAGMLIVAGDVFLLADHRHVTAPAAGVTALTMRVDAELGRGHGVFVTDSGGQIAKTLQKVSIETMQQEGAADEQGRILIDTGLLFFDVPATQTLAGLAGVGAKRPGVDERSPEPIDLYDDMTAALASGTQKQAYLAGAKTPAVRQELWRRLHGIHFQVMPLEGHFLHLGTTRQFRDAMVGLNPSPAAELFQQDILARGNWPLQAGRRVYHSVLVGDGNHTVLDDQSLVEHSILAAGSHIGEGSVVSQVLAMRKPLVLEPGMLLFQTPVREKELPLFAQVLCGVEDDFKGRHAEGTCAFLNAPIQDWLKRHGITADDIWPGIPVERRTLWTARLFPATPDRDSAAAVLWFSSRKKAPAAALRTWRAASRYSMAMLLEQADSAALIEHREVVSAYLQTTSLLEAIAAGEDRPVDMFVGHYSSPAACEACVQRLRDFVAAKAADPVQSLHQSRASWCAVQLIQRPDNPAPSLRNQLEPIMQASFAKIAEASEMGCSRIEVGENREAGIRPGMRIEAAAPVRLDLSGGWSDTPPYCYERGGHVVNVAIELNRQNPIRAMVRTIREPMLILETHDLGQHVEIRNSAELSQQINVRDPFALHKVALGLAGFAPTGRESLAAMLKRLGGGMIVSTECRVPKGSGLGTSSILAAAVLAALHAARGRETSHEELISQTLLLEQRLSTGGGWQDQVGGIVPAVKSTITQSGVPQRPVVEQLAMPEALLAAMEERLVVYFSGQQRLARDILRRVLGRWLGREPGAVMLLTQLKESAAALRLSLLKGQWPAAAREIARYWEIKKQLYPGSTTPTIDVLFMELREHYMAAGLAGAGGGGFAYFLCRDARQTQRLRQRLAEVSARPGSLGSVFDARISRTGLVVARNAL